MNILMITIGFRPNVGGIETHFDDFLIAADKRGFQTTVLTYQPVSAKVKGESIEKEKHWIIYRLPIIPGFFYTFVHSPILEFLYLIPGLFFTTPYLLAQKNYDVIHAHGLISGFVGVFWGKLFRKRVIISTHSIYHFPNGGAYRNFAKYIFSNSDKVLCLSEQSVNEIKQLGIPQERVKKFTYWIDLQKFKPMGKDKIKKQLGWEKRFVILFVGRLIPEKGIRELLKAASKWNKHISLAIAGVGPLEDEIKSYADSFNNILILGRVENKNLPRYYTAADALIVPSTHEEGFGRVLLESLACGTPVIAANRGGIIEAINKKVGFLIKITPENIKKVVEYCYTHRVKLEDKSKEARKFAENKFSEKNISAIIQAYE